jgi:DNA-binding NarL/FixJ family response regulator
VVVLPCDDAQARDAQADDAQADDAQAADAQAADARADDAQAADARSAHARAADAALRAGAAAVIDVGTAPELTVALLVAVSSGLRVLPGPVLDRLLTRARPVGDGAAPDVVEALGEQERHLLRLVASGLEIAAIAARLYVSERTAKRMVADLRDRLGVSTRIEMAAFAGRVGLLDLPGP